MPHGAAFNFSRHLGTASDGADGVERDVVIASYCKCKCCNKRGDVDQNVSVLSMIGAVELLR